MRPKRLLHLMVNGPQGPTGWLVRLPPTLPELLRPARIRARLAAVDPIDFADALDDLADGGTEALRRLGFTATRTG